MPNGKTHDVITTILFPIIIIGLIFLSVPLNLSIAIIGGYIFSSFMFNGDLDMAHTKPSKRWWILKFYWILYQKIFKHRSIFTHGIIIGTIIRLIYCLPLIIPIFIYLNIEYTNPILLYILIGLELGNIIHTISDTIFSN